MASILWRRVGGEGMERAELGSTAAGYRLSGTALSTHDGAAVEIRYSISLDEAWTTRVVGMHVRAPGDNRSLALVSDAPGTWQADGKPVPELEGAIDVDFAFTPATTTIALRRLGLEIGQHAETTAVVVSYPGREVVARSRVYERTAPRRFVVRSGDFSADLTVDENGFVTTYPGRWTAVTGP
jgi:hypothetical protein